jgi:hypothetical protein
MHASGQFDIVETTYLPSAAALFCVHELGCRTRCNVKAYDVGLCTAQAPPRYANVASIPRH